MADPATPRAPIGVITLELEGVIVDLSAARAAARATARADAGDDPDLVALADWKADQLLAGRIVADSLHVRPDAVRFVEGCAAIVPLAVVTRIPRRAADIVLARTGLAELVRVVVAGEDAPDRPDAGAYRRVVSRLEGIGVAIRGTRYALESSAAGAAAARAAGFRIAAVVEPGDGNAAPDFEPDVPLPNLRDAFDALRADAIACAADA